ncbi:hypothetical protein B0T16DRAFT_460289 [Cercophora newfieldiana]|uniref:Uncharacterized protein n=1 Tax=Cercophora newfieldiana TaxID=92897 RepID=A0AA40CNV3_9PEZI|nr:hypothetical protein B0T16DRAFT_460289 [Cercophora newfieldiana]
MDDQALSAVAMTANMIPPRYRLWVHQINEKALRKATRVGLRRLDRIIEQKKHQISSTTSYNHDALMAEMKTLENTRAALQVKQAAFEQPVTIHRLPNELLIMEYNSLIEYGGLEVKVLTLFPKPPGNGDVPVTRAGRDRIFSSVVEAGSEIVIEEGSGIVYFFPLQAQ